MSENQDIEYKAVWRDEYLQWLCGFANARGGTIYIGIDDTGKVVGLKNAERLLEDIPNKVVSVLGISAYVMLHTAAGSLQYLEVSVEPQAFPVNCKGLYYQRSGATNQLLRGTALNTFLLRKQGRTWDGIPTPYASTDSLSVEAFHPEPDAFFPGATVKLGFFEGPEILYQDVIDGPVIQQVDKTLDLIYTKYLKAKISYAGAQRIERYPFSRDAVREAVINAIAHKNYASGSPVQIRVYEDRLRIGNSCILPEGWTLDDLLGVHESLPHNPKIANVFFLAGYVESWGRGVQKVFTACKIDGIEPPEYRIVGSSLQVLFTAPADRVVGATANFATQMDDVPENVPVNTHYGLVNTVDVPVNGSDNLANNADVPVNGSDDPANNADVPVKILAKNAVVNGDARPSASSADIRQHAIMGFMNENPHVTINSLSEELHVSTRTIRRDIDALRKKGFVERVGSDKSGIWRVMSGEGGEAR